VGVKAISKMRKRGNKSLLGNGNYKREERGGNVEVTRKKKDV